MKKTRSFICLSLILSLLVSVSFSTVTPVYAKDSNEVAATTSLTAGSREVPKTLTLANMIDLTSLTLTGISKKKLTNEEISNKVKNYGTYIGNGTLSLSEYSDAMSYQWTDMTDYSAEASAKPEIDLEKKYTYAELETVMLGLSSYEGVYLYKIGESIEGRNIYNIEIDVPSGTAKRTVLLTGGVHARETAGPEYILKQLCELLKDNSKDAKDLLASTRFEVVPCVNPDGREGVCFNTSKYTYSDGALWKAASNGTDIGRNFPGVSIGYVLSGNKKTKNISSSASKIFYMGDYFGCNPETKALMKFVTYFVLVEKAELLVDYHQQGRVLYAGKPWQTKEQEKRSMNAAQKIEKFLNKGNKSTYTYLAEDKGYGLNGSGSTLSDYACALASGAKFSPAYGSLVFTDGSKEYPLIMLGDLDNASFTITEGNSKFATFTLEIGYGVSYTGYSSNTRQLQAKEYTTYHFDKLLYNLP